MLIEADLGLDEAANRIAQNRIGVWAKKRLTELLDDWCAELSDPSVLYRIERLEIDVTGIDPDTLETIGFKQVEKKLQVALRRALQSNGNIKPDAHQNGQTQEDLLRFFLHKGHLPWWADPADKTLLQTAFQQFSSQNTATIRAALNVFFSRTDTGQRLIQVLSDADLGRLLTQVAETSFAETCLVLKELHQKQYADWLFKRQTFWLVVWSQVFLSVLTENKIAVIRSLLREWGIDETTQSGSQKGLEKEFTPWQNKKQQESEVTLENAKEGSIGEMSKKERNKDAKNDLILRGPNEDSKDNTKDAHTEKEGSKKQQETTQRNGVPLYEEKEASFHESDTIYVHNAGLVLIAPFLPYVFEELGWVENKRFVHPEYAHLAVQWLQFVCDGQDEPPEYQLTLNKILCGLPIDAVYLPERTLTEAEKEKATDFLNAVLAQAPKLGLKSVDGLRGSFLLRRGVLRSGGNQWLLHIEQETFDIVLQNVPWNYAMIKLAWMEVLMYVDWTPPQ